MAANFKEIPLAPLLGHFDAQNPADEIGFPNFSLVKNFAVRGTRKRVRRGGWEKLFTERVPYNNADLHDQLVGDLLYHEPDPTVFTSGGGVVGYNYPYYTQPYSVGGYTYIGQSPNANCGYYPDSGFDGQLHFDTCFVTRAFVGYPYTFYSGFYGPCDEGEPHYYAGSYFYVDCPYEFPESIYPALFYGPSTPVYSPFSSYSGGCYDYNYYAPGCREAITHLNEVVTESGGRKLIAATMSRIYALNENTGNWKILADNLGNSAYQASQCGCNDVRFTSAVQGSYITFTNGFNEPLQWKMGDEAQGCDLWAAQPIPDLEAVGLSQAGGVVSWKGFTIFFDVTMDGVRKGGTVVWSDFEDPTSYIPSDTSSAGQSTVAVGERFLAASPLGDFLYLFSDRAIWRVTLVEGIIFSFNRIYAGTAALRYRYSLVNNGDAILYGGSDQLYIFNQYDVRPLDVEVPWINKVSNVIYRGLNEDDAAFGPINADRCDQFVGGWNEQFNEVWLSWPTDSNTCPNMTLVLNTQFHAADLVDHGFTAFRAYRQDNRPTIAQFLQEYGVCSFDELMASYVKEGAPCADTGTTAIAEPDYIWNETENPNLPQGPNGLCTALGLKTEDEFCRDCGAPTRFVMADAWDFCLKQYADETYYRERYVGEVVDGYIAYACGFTAFYVADGYDSVLQSGANDFGSDNEKFIKRLSADFDAAPQTVPNLLYGYVGYSAQAGCPIWIALEPVEMKCLSCFSETQQAQDNTRADDHPNFPCWQRGRYLHWRLKITGTGGGSTFSSVKQVVRQAEANTSR